MKKVWILLLLCVFTLSGCEEKSLPQISLVTGVEITCNREGKTLYRNYTQPGKVQRVLYHLRRQQTKGYAKTDPERVLGDVYRIEVKLSNGHSRIYRQRADRYVSVDCRRWKNIDESWGRRLYYLLLLIPSDPVANSAVG